MVNCFFLLFSEDSRLRHYAVVVSPSLKLLERAWTANWHCSSYNITEKCAQQRINIRYPIRWVFVSPHCREQMLLMSYHRSKSAAEKMTQNIEIGIQCHQWSKVESCVRYQASKMRQLVSQAPQHFRFVSDACHIPCSVICLDCSMSPIAPPRRSLETDVKHCSHNNRLDFPVRCSLFATSSLNLWGWWHRWYDCHRSRQLREHVWLLFFPLSSWRLRP